MQKTQNYYFMLHDFQTLKKVRKHLHDDLHLWCSIIKKDLLVIPLKDEGKISASLFKFGLSDSEYYLLEDDDVFYFTFKS